VIERDLSNYVWKRDEYALPEHAETPEMADICNLD
jgi:hypothetical protein